jgi:hypothetical protein
VIQTTNQQKLLVLDIADTVSEKDGISSTGVRPYSKSAGGMNLDRPRLGSEDQLQGELNQPWIVYRLRNLPESR